MDLQVFWFALVVVLFAGYFFLEGFDYGVGMLYWYLARNDRERRMALNAIGPTWGANEVWLITAGGAIFAAFPNWYATLFSGFYLALVLMLLGLIARGTALEYRSRTGSRRWRAVWDWAITLGSFIPAFLWGVALADLLHGVPIDASMNVTGGLLALLHPYAILGGVTVVLAFLAHGAHFLALKTDGDLRQRARAAARVAGRLSLVAVAAFLAWTAALPQVGNLAATLALAALVLALLVMAARRQGSASGELGAFLTYGIAVALLPVTMFTALFPRVMVSSLDPAWSLTIFNASSSDYTLKVMSIVALTLVPFILGYQAWAYWIFRRRITTSSHLEY
ncbi:MAG: cytochrome d ubiquinol oxidase subunit II [Firmicutes bacterium]|nr:cytochrome d ubiquinol oxidase subunit II [Bacillota bacterium]